MEYKGLAVQAHGYSTSEQTKHPTGHDKMRIFKNILHLTIVLALLATGFPVLKGDVNLDDRIDLADAVLSVRSVAKSVENPAVFEKNIENAIISLATAAGFRKVLKADRERASGNTLSEATPAVPVSGFNPGTMPEVGGHPADVLFLYKSVAFAPSPPPPHVA